MKLSRHLRRWSAAGAITVVLSALVLSRVACAPVQLPAAHATPAAPITPVAPDGIQHTASGDTTHAAAAPASPLGSTSVFASGSALGDALPVTTRPLPSDDDAPSTAPSAGPVPPVDRAELTLLAAIEGKLKRTPPPEVHGLIAEYRKGANRQHLIGYVQTELPNDLALRVTALRWIDDVRPEAERKVSGPPNVPGRGTGRAWVQPLKSK